MSFTSRTKSESFDDSDATTSQSDLMILEILVLTIVYHQLSLVDYKALKTSRMNAPIHIELQQLRLKLQEIYVASAHFRPLSLKPPILDSSLENSAESSEDSSPWTHQDQIPGLRQLRESIRLDLDVLDKFLDDEASSSLPPLSTNAPYLIAVWNELICAKSPVVSVFKMFDIGGSVSQGKTSGKRSGKKASVGVKVDVVAENGRRWIRVNTIKNSKILAEFREIDSYLTDNDSSEEYEGMPPTLAQKEFDNSVLRMGRSLVQAAKANPIEGTSVIPRITLRLTRLDPSLKNVDTRVARTIRLLRERGIDVELGERDETELMKRLPSLPSSPSPPSLPRPTRRITLDLSALIALVSDLTHFPLPANLEEANRRFIPPQEYREWKETRIEHKKPQDRVSKAVPELSIEDLPKVYVKQARALTKQLLQEMVKGMIQEIHDQLSEVTNGDLSQVEFWTTPEARSRCLLIVNKIGGANEKRRVRALLEHGDDVAGGIEAYWKGSRYPSQFIPILPIKTFPNSSNPDPSFVLGEELYSKYNPTPFSHVLKKTCECILAQEIVPDPRTQVLNGNAGLPDAVQPVDDRNETGEIQRAAVTKVNPRLTAHTVQSMLWGAELGWTTLTGNKSSVKAILREIRAARVSGRLDEEDMESCVGGSDAVRYEEDVSGCAGGGGAAALWVVDPRSLAEGMSSLPPIEY
ncbi:hypothetical protein NP233_g910 [Leucocoprinus birnbaumii]|uniref:DUF1308 domain-containing protein n=1 Tax=Leucocoprinus birnbaumii TaxID=56174 RepID=A0AAD5W4W8_9AGAR|nr:hypothetical protein NP233_g910 [Leucocoprinus birnbaumii]